MSPVLTHFCGGRQGRALNWRLPDNIRNMSGPDRLTSILWEMQLRTFVTYSGGDPAVCFTEAMEPGIKYMIQTKGYEPWGLIFGRQSVYNADGGPVWYARQKQFERIGQHDPSLQSWVVRLDAPGSDWSWEREWRIVRSSAVELRELELVGLLVGDPRWTGVRYANCVSVVTGQLTWGNFYPPLPSGLPRWLWNPANVQFQWLPPLFLSNQIVKRF
jgi:hypothetical protein